MAVSVSMPELGESVTAGIVTRWLKKEGQRVEADEPLLEVSTDKVDTEIPSPAAGVLREIAVGEDETVEVGALLAMIVEEPDASVDGPGSAQGGPDVGASEGLSAVAPAAAEPAGPSRPEQPAQASQPQASQEVAAVTPGFQVRRYQQERDASLTRQPTSGDGHYAPPLAHTLAIEHSVDLGTVTGSGVGGRIPRQDVLDAVWSRQDAEPEAVASRQAQPLGPGAALTSAAPSPAAARAPGQPALISSALRGTSERISRLRQVISQRMVESLQASAQLTTVVEADVTAIARLRERAKAGFEAREGVKLSFLPFFALAAVEALKVHPKLNAVIDAADNQVTYHDAEHLGIAVDAERGLMVPVIRDAGGLNLGGLARQIANLATRARSGHLGPDELAGGTFTLTNTGSRGALFDTPILNQPQVGILGTGSVARRPVVVDDPVLGEVIAVRSVVYLALTYDHRLVDGADAARFLGTVKSRLEEGAFGAELGL